MSTEKMPTHPKIQINPNLKWADPNMQSENGYEKAPFDLFEAAVETVRLLQKERSALMPFIEVIKVHFEKYAGMPPLMVVEGVLDQLFGIPHNLRSSVNLPAIDPKYRAEEIGRAVRNFGSGQAADIRKRIKEFQNRGIDLGKINAVLG